MPRATRIEANAAFVVTPARSLREHLSDSNTAALLDRDLDVVFLEESIAMLAQGDPTLNADVSAIAARVHAQRPCARIVVVAPHAGNVTLHAQIVERTRGAAEDVGGLWLPLIEVTNELGTVTAELSTYSLAAAMFRVITQTSAPNASVNTISQADAARVRSAIETVWSRAPNPNFDFAHGAARAPYWCSLACNTLPNVRMLSADLNTCTSATPSPQSGETYFSSTCGCGYFR